MVDKTSAFSEGVLKTAFEAINLTISRPQYILYVITNENGIFGSHAGMVLLDLESPEESLLYDPNGSYSFKTKDGEEILSGSGYIFPNGYFSLESYIQYQKTDGDEVYAHIFYIDKIERDKIKESIYLDRDCSMLGCAICTSEVLKSEGNIFKDLEISRRPTALGDDLRAITKKNTNGKSIKIISLTQ